MRNNPAWLGVPRAEIEEKRIFQGDMNGRFAYYRTTFTLAGDSAPGAPAEGAALPTGAATLLADVSAVSRYRLWVNGNPVTSGPLRGSEFEHYFDPLDLSPYLVAGKNVIAAQVLLCDAMYTPGGFIDNRAPLQSVATLPYGHRFALGGTVTAPDGTVLADVTTGTAPYTVFVDNTFYLTKEYPVNGNMGAITETIDFTKTSAHWKEIEFDDSAWHKAEPIEPVNIGFEMNFGILKNLPTTERIVPQPFEKERRLCTELGEPVFGGADSITVPARTIKTILFDSDTHLNGFFRYAFSGGAGASVTFIYFEKFTLSSTAGGSIASSPTDPECKRDDWQNGSIGDNGQTDRITLDGSSLVYEPFWYRTMRFLKIIIETADQELVMQRPQVLQTGYPLNPQTRVSSSAAWVKPLYEMCERTIQNCVMESYMDCPFWEQMQYTMDTRLEMLFTYVCSTDTRLARKTLKDFHESLLPVGLVQARTPTNPKQIISTFSLHYIFMLWEYYERTGDAAVLKRYRADVDAILEYYDRHIAQSGLVEKLGFWEFVDWQDDWNEFFGTARASLTGASTIVNLMYACALKNAASIARETGRAALSDEYTARQQAICKAVQNLCWDGGRGLYREGPECDQFTQHAQSWAILNGMVSRDEAAAMLEKAFTDPDVLRCCFSTCYELFRACEYAGRYDLTKAQMDWWIALLDEHCTTCPETPHHSRSECHGWSALPLYELVRVIAGVRVDERTKTVTVTPHLDYVPDIAGEVVTEGGMVRFSLAKAPDGTVRQEVTVPAGYTLKG